MSREFRANIWGDRAETIMRHNGMPVWNQQYFMHSEVDLGNGVHL
jgi:hypothetical protein